MLRFLLYVFIFSSLKLICLTRMPPTYNDFYARHKLWPMAQIFANFTDPNDPNQVNNKTNNNAYMAECFDNPEFYKGVVVPCDMLGNNTNITCSGAFGVAHDEEAMILMFRWTFPAEAYEENVYVNMTVTFPGGGTVAKFWYNGFLTIWNGGIRDAFFAAKNQNPTYELWVTGFSMGGSLAANAAGYISALGYMSPNDIKLITFGQPRIGHADIAARYPSLVPYMYRVTHRLDHVPHTPPLEIGFVHSRNEIWYNNSMLEGDTYIECDAGESMNCSDSVFPNDFAVLEIKTQHYVDKHGNGEHWYFNKTGTCVKGNGFSKMIF